MLLNGKLWFLGFFGLAAGGIIAAGIFAFLAIIGVFPRLMGKTGTKGKIMLFETCIININPILLRDDFTPAGIIQSVKMQDIRLSITSN